MRTRWMSTALLVVALCISACQIGCTAKSGAPMNVGDTAFGACAAAVQAYEPAQITIEALTASEFIKQDVKEKLLEVDEKAMLAKKSCYAAAAIGDATARALAIENMGSATNEANGLIAKAEGGAR